MNQQMKEQEEKRGFTVFSQRMAGFAMMNGCKLIKFRPDYYDNTKNVYIFYDGPKLQEAIKEYKKLYCNK